MKKRLVIAFFFLTTFALTSSAWEPDLPPDTILMRAMSAAEKYNGLVESYEAEVYTRTYVETVKRNFLHKYTHLIPGFALHDRRNDEAVIETIGTLRYDYPKNYAHDVNYVTGTLTSKKDIGMIPFGMLSINVYGETTNDESFFMPVRFSTAPYYRYRLHQTFTENGKTYYAVYFTPIYNNPKLLKGSFIVESGTWRIVHFQGEGQGILSRFSFEVTMGNEWVTNYLPVKFTVYQTVSYLGNVLANRLLANISYKNIRLQEVREPQRLLNLSDFYSMRMDSVPVHSDSVFWNRKRPIPLQAVEKDVITRFETQQLEEDVRKILADSTSGTRSAQEIAQRVVLNSNYRYKSTRIGYSGLLNPAMLGYSSRDGITYGQKLSFNIDLKRERTVKINAFGGYMFGRKEFSADITSTWNYDPFHLGSATLSVGKGNPVYSRVFVDEIPDSLQNRKPSFDDMPQNYYLDYYLKLFNTHEITNGLLLNTGVEYHFRRGKSNTAVLRSAGDEAESAAQLFSTRKSLAPFVRLSWTPEQYYRYEGRQKIYVHSRYPTFKMELSHSFKNTPVSNSEYSRIEFDISQNIPLGLMNSLQYHVGAGRFINQKSEYFADFVYFSENNFPETWNDGLGGSFNLLNRELYNASNSYIQAHAMFETPFLVLKNIPFLSDFAEKERIYLSQLCTPQIESYTEFGYGIGNRYFSAGLFVSFHKTHVNRVGVRAAFEL